MKIIFYTILFCFVLLNKTNCQDEFEKNRIIDTYRQDIKEIFDQKIRIKFQTNILGTGSESENDSYFFPPDKLVDEKYEVLCYYSGHHGLAAIFICDNKIFYRTNKVPFPHYRITKESEIENHNNEAYSEFSNAIEYASEDEEKKDFIENGFKALKNAREAKNRKNDYITKEIKISTDLKMKILSAFQKMKNLTPSTNEWKPYQNIFSFLSMKPVLKYGCESYDFIDNGQLISKVYTDNIDNAPNAVDAKSTAERDLRREIDSILLTKGPVYQLGYNDAFFGFNLPSCYYPPNSLPHIVNNTMDALLSYMADTPSEHTEKTLMLEFNNLHVVLDNHKSTEWEGPVPEANKRLLTSIENELGNYALAFPNRPLRTNNGLSDDDIPKELPKKFELLCHSHSSRNFSRIFIIEASNLTFFELDTKKEKNRKETKEKINKLFDKLLIEQTENPENDDEKLHYAHIGYNFGTSARALNHSKPNIWNRSQITLSPKTISAMKETWKSLKELTRTTPNYCEFYYFPEYYPTFFDEESPQSYFQECLQKKAPTSPLIDPEDHTFSLLGYEDSYFGASPPSVFYKCDEIPYLLNDVISDIFELKNDSSLPKQEAVIEKLNDLQEAIQKSFPKKAPLTKPS